MKNLNEKFAEKNLSPPKRHFIFGDELRMNTINAANGQFVDWSYHVVLAVRINDPNPELQNTLYILDPSLSPKPLSKEKYHQLFNHPDRPITGFVTCHEDTLDKFDSCQDPIKDEDRYIFGSGISILLQ